MNDGRFVVRVTPGEAPVLELDGLELTEAMPITRATITLTPAGNPQVVLEVAPVELLLELDDVDVAYMGTLPADGDPDDVTPGGSP